jgi:hypothetical protein
LIAVNVGLALWHWYTHGESHASHLMFPQPAFLINSRPAPATGGTSHPPAPGSLVAASYCDACQNCFFNFLAPTPSAPISRTSPAHHVCSFVHRHCAAELRSPSLCVSSFRFGVMWYYDVANVGTLGHGYSFKPPCPPAACRLCLVLRLADLIALNLLRWGTTADHRAHQKPSKDGQVLK